MNIVVGLIVVVVIFAMLFILIARLGKDPYEKWFEEVDGD